MAASPSPRIVRVSNQFQHRQALAASFCRGAERQTFAIRELGDARALRELLRRLLAPMAQHDQRRAAPGRAALGHVDQVFAARQHERCAVRNPFRLHFDPDSKRPGSGSDGKTFSKSCRARAQSLANMDPAFVRVVSIRDRG
jgi:hypothetical protein